MTALIENEAPAGAAIAAIRRGDIDALLRLIGDVPGLASATIQRAACRDQPPYTYPLIAATTDWPGHFPRVAESIAVLVAAGADVNARSYGGGTTETALHGAASSDDVTALDALLDAGAAIDAPGAVIAGGTPLDDAVAFAQWQAARRLVERGAEVAVWHAAALGLVDRLATHFTAGQPPARYPWGRDAPDRDDTTIAFWCACHGGQRAAAEFLLARGADPSWRTPWDSLTPLDAARRSHADELADWLVSIGAR